METENLLKFMDGLVEGAYQAKLFPKEGVQQVLQINELIKQKLVAVDTLGNQNTELTVKVEVLEAENKKLQKWFEDLGVDLDELNKKVDVNDIDVPLNSIEDLSKAQNNMNGEVSKFQKKLAEKMAEAKKV